MEFVIDFARVRKILADEAALAGKEIREQGVLSAYRNSLLRHDARLAQADDADTLACRAGCSWCCHFSVDVRPVEAFNIVEFMKVNFTPAERQQLQARIEANARIMSSLDEIQRMQLNIPCPFLCEDRCSIYDARPQTCRNYHATDASGCRQSYEEPDNFDIAPEYAPQVYQAGGAHVDAFCKAMQNAGYDIAAYELNTALNAALLQPEATRQRFETKSVPFEGLDGTEVPMEFIDIDE